MTACIKTIWGYPKVLRNWLLFGFIVGAFILGGIVAAQQTSNPPVMVLSSKLIYTTVPQNGEILLYVTSVSSEYRDCMGQITQEFTRDRIVDGKALPSKRRVLQAQPIVHAGESEYVIEINLPEGVTPGEWRFQGETIYECGKRFWLFGNATQRYRTQSMPFTVVPPLSLIPVR